MQSAKRAKNDWSCGVEEGGLLLFGSYDGTYASLCRGAAEFRRQNISVQVSGMDRTDLLKTIVDIIRQ